MSDEKSNVSHEEPTEEFFNNVATDVEAEEVDTPGESSLLAKPWDPAKIRISTKPFSLRQVVDMVNDGDIDLAPDFQRLYVWKPAQLSRLIESILLGIPLPAFYFNQDREGTMQVVDGVQRLTTIHRFAGLTDESERAVLTELEYLVDLEGKKFTDLDVSLRRRFQQTQIFVNVIEPQTPDDVKFEVFRRINTGGSPLTGQEIRHCMSRLRSRTLLKRLVALPVFRDATDGAFKGELRMADREVALRFCAFRHLGDVEKYREFTSLDSFLLDFIRQVDGSHKERPQISDEDLARLERDFEQAMRSAVAVFGSAAFRKFPTWAKRRGPINRALFDSWSVALADYKPEALKPHGPSILTAARKRMEEYQYNSAMTQGTGDYNKVKLRLSVARELIRQAVQ